MVWVWVVNKSENVIEAKGWKQPNLQILKYGWTQKNNFGPIPCQAAEIIGGLLATEWQSYRHPKVLSIRVGEIFLCLISINSLICFARRGIIQLLALNLIFGEHLWSQEQWLGTTGLVHWWAKCCVFQPAFGCCGHPKAGQTTFFIRFQPFLFISNLF